MKEKRKPFDAVALLQAALPYVVVIAFIAGWEALVDLNGIAPIYLPAPSAIVRYLVAMLADGSLPYNLAVTFLRIIGGFLVAAVSGITVGVLMGMSPLAARIVDPWIAALYPLPKISLIPLLIIWLGTGESYKIVISAVTAFFPVVISTFAAIRQVDPGLLEAARDLGANQRQIQLKVVIPAALPGILSGLHLGMGVTVIMVVAAEMIGGSSESGMGYVLVHSGQVMETEKVFAGLIVLAVFGAAVTKLQKLIDRRLAPWVEPHR
ncbi:MAG TPA: ABC transporter permease [Xanthobacteraceae bacterium]|nr:ABC transporter permease [Xanthobacteraceae bacterium]